MLRAASINIAEECSLFSQGKYQPVIGACGGKSDGNKPTHGGKVLKRNYKCTPKLLR